MEEDTVGHLFDSEDTGWESPCHLFFVAIRTKDANSMVQNQT